MIEYLKQNPEAAQQSYIEAQKILHTPGMVQSVLNSRTQNAADPAYQAKLQAMQSDPDLKHVFDDIKANGAGAMEKYWNDSELMSKISEKMGSINLNNNSRDPKKAAPSSQVSLCGVVICTTRTSVKLKLCTACQPYYYASSSNSFLLPCSLHLHIKHGITSVVQRVVRQV